MTQIEENILAYNINIFFYPNTVVKYSFNMWKELMTVKVPRPHESHDVALPL